MNQDGGMRGAHPTARGSHEHEVASRAQVVAAMRHKQPCVLQVKGKVCMSGSESPGPLPCCQFLRWPTPTGSATHQHLPLQCVPSLLEGLIVNQSRSPALLISMYLISACSSCSKAMEQAAHVVADRVGQRRPAAVVAELRCNHTESCQHFLTSFSRFCHSSLSRGPALTVSSGIFCTVARVVGSHD